MESLFDSFFSQRPSIGDIIAISLAPMNWLLEDNDHDISFTSVAFIRSDIAFGEVLDIWERPDRSFDYMRVAIRGIWEGEWRVDLSQTPGVPNSDIYLDHRTCIVVTNPMLAEL